MAALLTDQTTDTTGTGAAMSGPCSVCAEGTFAGATVYLEAAISDSGTRYQPIGWLSPMSQGGWIAVDIQGAYWIRAKLAKAGTTTSVTVTANQ